MPKMMLELFTKPVNIRKLVEKLSFDEDQLEDAARENPALLFEAGRYRVMKLRNSKKASFAYDQSFAAQRLVGRKKKDSAGKRAMTEGAVADMAIVTDEIATLRSAMDAAYAEEEVSKLLVECVRQRGEMIKAISRIRASEISSELAGVRTRMQMDEFEKVKKSVRERVDAEDEEED